MEWKDKPDKPGWWWYVGWKYKTPQPVRLWSTPAAARKHFSYTVSDARQWQNHRWYGPIPEPPKDDQ